MSEQALDLKRSVQIIRRRWLVIGIVAALGLAGGAAYAALQPPSVSSTALVRTVTAQGGSSASNTATMVVIASSDPVLTLALPSIQPPVSKQTLLDEIQVKSPTTGIIAITAQGRTAAQAKSTANAVAQGFVDYISSPRSLSGSTRALLLQPASIATGRSLVVTLAIFGLIGLLLGAVLAIIAVLAISRRDRRLRLRDEIADSIGIPVLASIPVVHPADAAGWVKLLTEYEPAAVDAWRLRGALDYLGLGGSGDAGQGEGMSLTLLSLQSDPRALAIGPQLAVFAASLGVRTHLVIGHQQDPEATASLRAACTGMTTENAKWSRYLQVTVRDQEPARDQLPAGVTVLVCVVDGHTPRLADQMHTTAAVLAVSSGGATAEELARVAVSAADRGRRITGILVADPDSTDHTTGRLPQLARTTARHAPTRLTGIPTETRQWMTQTRQP